MSNLRDAIAASPLRSGGTISVHHHFRNGDTVMAQALGHARALGLTDLHLMASSLFPCHEALIPFLRDGTVTRISTAYMTGPLADAVAAGVLAHPVRLTTHGGRARMIAGGEVPIDLAVIAAPASDGDGNLTGADGAQACGPLGYAMVDADHARHVIAVAGARLPRLTRVCIPGDRVSHLVLQDDIGDARQIESGTTARRADATGQAIADLAAQVIAASGVLRDGFAFQTGAGAVSLAVARAIAPMLAARGVTGNFAAGGITAAHVDMLRAGLVRRIWDVQAFDRAAVASYRADAAHHAMSADLYANPDRPDCIAHRLDVMILGAAEVDLDFNVNVTTTGDGRIIGGSGGHADTAEGAKLAIVTVPTRSAGFARIVPCVRCITTPGTSIDAVVTERGIAVNPSRPDLARDLARAGLPLVAIADLAGAPLPPPDPEARVVAISEDRRGNRLDVIRRRPAP